MKNHVTLLFSIGRGVYFFQPKFLQVEVLGQKVNVCVILGDLAKFSFTVIAPFVLGVCQRCGLTACACEYQSVRWKMATQDVLICISLIMSDVFSHKSKGLMSFSVN